MEDILKLKNFYLLKKVYRLNSVENRKESAAEHTWSSLILADYIFEKYKDKFNLNKTKVFELLLYHDVVEIEAGDIPLMPNNQENLNKEIIEDEAANFLLSKFPFSLNNKFLSLYKEFKEQKTLEARFAKAIDSLDAIIHELDYKEDWKGWSKEFLESKKLKYFKDFPILKDIFYELLDYLEKNNYFK